MNKSDLIKALAKEFDLPARKAEQIVDMVFDTMEKTLASGDRIEIRGFGSFVVNEYEGYTGRNPKTGTEVPISPRRVMVFKPSAILKQRINNGHADHRLNGESKAE